MSDFSLVRQPVFNPTGALLGYDLRFDEAASAGHGFSQSLLSGTFDLVRNRLPAFVPATSEQLLEDAFLMVEPGATIVVLPSDLDPTDEIRAAIMRLRQAGVAMALELTGTAPCPAESLVGCTEWIRVDIESGSVPEIVANVERIRKGLPKPLPRLIAGNVRDLQQYEAVLQQGFDGFQGAFFSRPEPLPGADVPQNTVSALRLMGMARDPMITDPELEEVIETDPVLTFQLLRLVNSASLSGRGIASIGQALRLIGRAAFLRWLAVAIAAARHSQSAVDQELVRQAVERGRLLEQLAGGSRDAGTLFLVGLFSLLDAVFRMPMSDLLERVTLSAEASAALLDRTGPYADAILFAESYEMGLFENAHEVAREMGVDPAQLSAYYTNAVRWTSEALTGADGPTKG